MGLTGDLNVALSSLMANTQAMDVTSTNIANQNTPGYARRVVVLEEAAPSGLNNATSGVEIAGVQSIRDTVVDMAINSNTSQEYASNTLSSSLSAVQTLFSDTTSGSVASSIDSFFSALQSLSASPTDSSLRTSALTAAQNVASAFQTTASEISQSQTQADRSVVQDTSTANSLLQEIAATNAKISQSTAMGQTDNADEDQLSSMLTKLSQVMNYQTVNSSDGLTLTTTDGVPLVVGSKAYALTNSLNSAGYNQVIAGGVDITSSIDGGSLGGYLSARDQTLASMASTLNQFADQFATAVNNVQTAGSDVNGTAGTNFFSVTTTSSTDLTGAASSIKVALTSGSQIAAAASGGASGDNSNLTNMIALQSSNIINGVTPDTAAANMTFALGNTISQANSSATASSNIITQLTNQQGSVEGVSLDEETSNLLLYQRSYQSAAKVISVIDNLMTDLLNMGATSGGFQ
ncbi:MAG: flagellar hook-associated protein FlgK [Acidobacteriota bacterium]|nr:flagellar hook-associated protein FlgK [Acidobacteriota bacterium]